jgi:MFS family permease
VSVRETAGPGATRQDRIYNFISCLIDAVGFPLGIAFFSSSTILPILLRHLGASDLTIGCLPALANLLTFLPGFLVVDYLNRRKRVRGYLFWIAMAERLALVPLIPLTAAWGLTHPQWLIAAVFICITCHTTWMGLNQPSYWVAVGKTVPAQWRGRLFGFAGGIAGFLSIGIERLMSAQLGGPGGGFPNGFSRCFLVGCVLLFVSVLPLGALREPSFEPKRVDPSEAKIHFGRQLLAVWRSNRGFRRFLYGYAALQLSTLAAPFYILHAAKHLMAGPTALAGFTGTMVFGSTVGGLLWGAWADRAGNKKVLVWSAALAVVAPVAAIFAGSNAGFYGVFAALALSGAGSGLSGFNIVMEFASEAREIPLYTAIANAVTAVPRAVAPILGGIIAGATGAYHLCFIASAVLAVISAVLNLRITEPRHAAVTGGS